MTSVGDPASVSALAAELAAAAGDLRRAHATAASCAPVVAALPGADGAVDDRFGRLVHRLAEGAGALDESVRLLQAYVTAAQDVRSLGLLAHHAAERGVDATSVLDSAGEDARAAARRLAAAASHPAATLQQLQAHPG